MEEKAYDNEGSRYVIFRSWCQGLPSILNTCYYYNRSAVKDLAEILEVAEEELEMLTERFAEEKLTWMLYREIFC